MKFLLFSLFIGSVVAYFPEEYPYYCNKNTSTREIPALSAEELAQVSSLKQVQVIIRHGARTPYQKYQCWANYTVSWNNCNVTELMLPSPSYTAQSRDAPWLFRKIYDGSENFLGGNCLTGQLIGEGYLQEEANGNYLRAAYLENSNTNLNLFPTVEWDQINTTTEIYLRSDDQERTLLSAQTMMHTFFNVSDESIVDWHTGDYDLDQLYPNSEVCPLLSTLQASIYATPEWIAENTSTYQQTLNQDLNDILGGPGEWDWNYIFDCIMTTVCTDRTIPDGSVSDGAVMNQEIFNATIAQSEFTYAFLSLYNNSQWAKLAMGNTAWHVRNNLESAINSTEPLKLAVFGGHDTTIMPFLAAVIGTNWDKLWAAYASMITIELYGNVDTTQPDLFRLVYNGKAQLVPGCTTTLCSVDVLLDALAFGQEFMPCDVPTVDGTDDDDTSVNSNSCDDKKKLDQTDWLLLLFSSMLFGVVIGAAAIIFVEKQRGMTTILSGSSKKTVTMNQINSPLAP